MTDLQKADALENAFFAEIAKLKEAGMENRSEALVAAMAALPLMSAAAIYDAIRA